MNTTSGQSDQAIVHGSGHYLKASEIIKIIVYDLPTMLHHPTRVLIVIMTENLWSLIDMAMWLINYF